MKTIDKLIKQDLENIKVLCFDCDGVTVEEGTKLKEKNNILTVQTSKISQEITGKLEQLKKRFFLIFSSGRSLLYVTRMYEPILWNQVALQAENGLFTLYQGKVEQLEKISEQDLNNLTQIKNEIRNLAETNSNILGFEPKQLIITTHCNQPEPEILKIVQKYDTDNKYYCLWSGEAYDVGIKKYNKGTGLEFLLKKLELSFKNVLAIGNDPNDKEMVERAKISITTDPQSIISGTDFVTNNFGVAGGEESIDKLLELTL